MLGCSLLVIQCPVSNRDMTSFFVYLTTLAHIKTQQKNLLLTVLNITVEYTASNCKTISL